MPFEGFVQFAHHLAHNGFLFFVKYLRSCAQHQYQEQEDGQQSTQEYLFQFHKLGFSGAFLTQKRKVGQKIAGPFRRL